MAKNLLGLYAKISNEEADMLLSAWKDPGYWDYRAGDAKKYFDRIIFKDLKKTIAKFTQKYGNCPLSSESDIQKLLDKMKEELNA